MPLRHTAVGLVVHAEPWLQALHAPLLQTPVGQVVPLGRAAPSLHIGAPVLHVTVPTRHASGLPVQAVPAAHATQVFVELHTRFVPHEAPSPFGVLSVQTGAPLAHEMTPLKQGLGLVVQLMPCVQALQTPLEEQTIPAPQLVPAGLFAPSVQTGAPVAHDTTPTLHAPVLVVQLAPALHAMQAPLPLHTWPTPQAVPAMAFAPFTHVVEPELQSVRPVMHGAPAFEEQAFPATQAPQLPLASQT